MQRFLIYILPLALLAADPSAAQMKMRGTSGAGRLLFFSAAISTNGLSCAHCHSISDESVVDDGLLRPGHSLRGAAARTTWWGKEPDDEDAYPDVAAAAVVCVEHFQRNPEKLTAQQILDLKAFLVSISRGADRTPLPLSAAADKTGEYRGYDGGDQLRGRGLFFAACHNCHPNGNAGIAPALPRDREASFYARKVREGDGLGAVLSQVDPNAYNPEAGLFMPFFGADRLSQPDLRDIIAYIKSLPAPPPEKQ